MSDPDDGIQRILVVTAHPDDADFGCSGTIANWTAKGIEVIYCLATDGNAGGFDESVSRIDMARIRREEQTAAAKVVGVEQLHWLGHQDGQVTASIELRRDISRVIRKVRPDRVVCQSPERNWDRIYASHPDHMATGEAALCAVYPDARNPFAHPSLLADEDLHEHTAGQIYVIGHENSDVVVDITDTFDKKLAALACHESQIGHRDRGEMETMLRGWSGAVAKQHGLDEGRLAEAFRLVHTP